MGVLIWEMLLLVTLEGSSMVICVGRFVSCVLSVDVYSLACVVFICVHFLNLQCVEFSGPQ